MVAVYATYNGSAFVPTEPMPAHMNQMALVTLLDSRPPTVDEQTLLSFAGTLSQDDADAFSTALKETRKIDATEW